MNEVKTKLTPTLECQLCFEPFFAGGKAYAFCHNCQMRWCKECSVQWFKQTLPSQSHHCPFCREKDNVTLPFAYRTPPQPETKPRTIYSCLFGQVLCWAILFVFVLLLGWMHENVGDYMFYVYMAALAILAFSLLIRLRDNLVNYYSGDDALDDDEEAVLS